MNPISISEIMLLLYDVLASWLQNKYLTILYLFHISVISYLMIYI